MILTGPRFRWVRAALSLPLALLAFLSLEKSVPGVVFFHNGEAHWSAEGFFEISKGPATLLVTVKEKSLHQALRARFSVCPEELKACEAGKFQKIPLPASGELSFHFPEQNEPISMEFFRNPFHPLYLLFLALLLAAGLLAFTDSVQRLLFSFVMLTSGPYFAVSMGRWRGMDVAGHLDHVARIAKESTLFVNARACWECHQPPAYYAFASSLLLWPTQILPSDAVLLQGLALLFHCLSVPFIVESLRPYARSTRHLLLYAGLVCLWPAAVFQSVRLGNDGPLNLAAFLCLFLLLRRQYLAACFAASAGYLVKNSGVVLLALSGAWILWNYKKKALSSTILAACGLALLSGPALNLLTEKRKGFDNRRFAEMAPPLKTHDPFLELLLPDPIAFVSDAFLNPWISTPNRDRTPNYFWKSSLTGEWSFNFPFAAILTSALSLVLFFLLTTALLQTVLGSGLRLFPVLAIGSGISAIAVYRYTHHFANHADFRFVYPAVALGVALLLAQARGRLERPAFWLTASFLSLSQAFFALLWIFESR